MPRPRHTARGLVIREGQVLFMERWRDDLHYFSIPGGGIEAGETPEQTVVREIKEETTVDIQPIRRVIEMHDDDCVHAIYLCEYLGGEPMLPAESEEARIQHAANAFAPRWVPITEAGTLPFMYWDPIKDAVLQGLENGFPDEVAVVQAPPNR